VARCELADEFLADLRRLDAQRRTPKAKLAAAVSASGTTLMEVFGVGPDRALLTAARTYEWSARSSA
jgi:hypothetical protein